jgi:hypothetical protein
MILTIIFSSCNSINKEENNPEKKQENSIDSSYLKSQLSFDHILVFCNNKSIEDSLKQYFVMAEKLSSEHKGQGTRGRYILLLNSFIELLYIADSSKIKNNEVRFRSPYLQRWNYRQACPFSFGLILNPYDSSGSGYPFEAYYSPDIPEGEYYLMSAGNRDQTQPMIYASEAGRATPEYENLEEMLQKTDSFKREDLRTYLQHPSGIQKLTKTILTTPETAKPGDNHEMLNTLNDIEIRKGDKYYLTLIFDEGKQGKFFTFRNINMKIEY